MKSISQKTLFFFAALIFSFNLLADEESHDIKSSSAPFDFEVGYPFFLAANWWLNSDLAFGLEGPHAEVVNSLQYDGLTHVSRQVRLERNTQWGARFQFINQKSLISSQGLIQIAVGQYQIRGQVTPSLGSLLVGEAQGQFLRIVWIERWKHKFGFFQIGTGFRIESLRGVEIGNEIERQILTEEPLLKGLIIYASMGKKF